MEEGARCWGDAAWSEIEGSGLDCQAKCGQRAEMEVGATRRGGVILMRPRTTRVWSGSAGFRVEVGEWGVERGSGRGGTRRGGGGDGDAIGL
jgi:hypothetical protein